MANDHLVAQSDVGKSSVGVQTLKGSAKSYNHFEFPVGLGIDNGKNIITELDGSDHSVKVFEKLMVNTSPENGNCAPPERAQWAIVTAKLPTKQESVTFMVSGCTDDIKTTIVEALKALDSSAEVGHITKTQTGRGHKSFGVSSGFKFKVHNEVYPDTILLTSENYGAGQLKAVADALVETVFDSSVYGTTSAPEIEGIVQVRGSNGTPLASDGYQDTLECSVSYKDSSRSYFCSLRIPNSKSKQDVESAFRATVTGIESIDIQLKDSSY